MWHVDHKFLVFLITFAAVARSYAGETSEKAKSADGFVDSMGVVVHLENVNTVYGTHLTDYIEPALAALGIRHVRDGGMASPTNTYGMTQMYVDIYGAVASYVQQKAGHRLGFDLITAPVDYGSSNGVNSCDLLTASPVASVLGYLNNSYIDSFEGMNEYDVEYPLFTPNCVTASTWVAENTKFQQALYNSVKQNSAASGFPVIGPSFATVAGMTAMSNVSAYEDYANQHSYPDGRYPSADIATNEAQMKNINGSKPYYATETGYYTLNDKLSGVSDMADGKYYSRLFFEYFNAGVVKTYAYELIDDVAQSGIEAHFGLLNSNGTPKPGFTAIQNEIAILQDPGAAFTPGSLTYSLGTIPSTLHHTLLQKRNGAFYLVLWQEISSYNLTTDTDISNPTVSVQVTLAKPASSASYFNPLTSSAAEVTESNISTFTVPVPDSAVIIEIVP